MLYVYQRQEGVPHKCLNVKADMYLVMLMSSIHRSFDVYIGDVRYSVTVKTYIWRHVNILSRNRRAIVVIDTGGTYGHIAMVIIGGITVDSIRMDPQNAVQGRSVKKGDYLGAFARGGSAVALFFSQQVQLVPKLQQFLRNQPKDRGFKVQFGDDLCE